MAWKDRLLRASFRGVEFGIDSHDTQAAGRRAAIHEYPTQDRPLAEDLGRRTKRYEINGWIVGENYDRTRDRLIRACDQAGPGELVHPYLGTVQALCLELDVSERTSEGRMCRVTLRCVDAGTNEFPTDRENLESLLRSPLDGLRSDALSAVDAARREISMEVGRRTAPARARARSRVDSARESTRGWVRNKLRF